MGSESVGKKATIIGSFNKRESVGRQVSGDLVAIKMETTTEPTMVLKDEYNDPRFVVWLTEAELEALLEIVREGEDEIAADDEDWEEAKGERFYPEA